LFPGEVLDADASSAPCSSGIVSGPGVVPVAACVVDEDAAALVLVVVALEAAVVELVLALEPQPVNASAATAARATEGARRIERPR
jgi:hypothetical protein